MINRLFTYKCEGTHCLYEPTVTIRCENDETYRPVEDGEEQDFQGTIICPACRHNTILSLKKIPV